MNRIGITVRQISRACDNVVHEVLRIWGILSRILQFSLCKTVFDPGRFDSVDHAICGLMVLGIIGGRRNDVSDAIQRQGILDVVRIYTRVGIVKFELFDNLRQISWNSGDCAT